MLIFVRSLLFNFFLLVWTICAGIILLPLCCTIYPIKIWTTVLLYALQLICGTTLEVRNSDNLPKQAFIIASKHQSALETIVFSHIFNKASYILKKELIWLPIIGIYLYFHGMIFIDRKGRSSALRSMLSGTANAIKTGHHVVIFPQGTRTLPGEQLPYHSGIVSLYNHNIATIIPVALNTGLFWPKNSFLRKPGKCVIEFLPQIPPGLNKDQFMAKLQDDIERVSDKLLLEV